MAIPILEKKSVPQVKIDAKRALHSKGLLGKKSQVKSAVDVSDSMRGMFNAGIVDGLVTRILGLGLNMDDNGAVEMIALDGGARELEAVTAQNLDGYVSKRLAPLVGGGTNYTPSIRKVLETSKPGDPVLALCFTDGYNYDEDEAEQALIEASEYPIFYQWFGIYTGGRRPRFPFLERMNTLSGRRIDNAGFSPLSLDTITDEELYAAMLVEYPSFLTEAQRIGMLPWNPSNDPRRRQRRGFFRR